MKAREPQPFPRICLTIEESAISVGLSTSAFRDHVLPHLRVIQAGSARLVPVRELDAWADRMASMRAPER